MSVPPEEEPGKDLDGTVQASKERPEPEPEGFGIGAHPGTRGDAVVNPPRKPG